jgi:hypothetical protein
VHTGGLKNLAWINWRLDDYSTAQILASEAQISADLYREAQALNVGATCNQSLGNYKQSLFLCDRARNLLSLCGLTGRDTDHEIMITRQRSISSNQNTLMLTVSTPGFFKKLLLIWMSFFML